MDSDRRRATVERARKRAATAGVPMESEPAFVAWVEERRQDFYGLVRKTD